MTNFAQTMHDWQRMCKYFERHYSDACCEHCPLESCGAVWEMDDTINWEEFEKKISTWAAEHKEPIYPTWREYLKEKDLITSKKVYFSDEYGAGFKLEDCLNKNADRHIPAKIATALGLEPHYE